MGHNNNQPFTTKDRDNDEWSSGNCAVHHRSGWWHGRCTNANLNGRYYRSNRNNDTAIYWWTWGNRESLKRVEMKIKVN